MAVTRRNNDSRVVCLARSGKKPTHWPCRETGRDMEVCLIAISPRAPALLIVIESL
jgi:hypothetical protein